MSVFAGFLLGTLGQFKARGAQDQQPELAQARWSPIAQRATGPLRVPDQARRVPPLAALDQPQRVRREPLESPWNLGPEPEPVV
jgi:hypothetical protein